MLMVFGFPDADKGGAVKSRSLMVGAAVNWAGHRHFLLQGVQVFFDMLIMAVAVFAGYIIQVTCFGRPGKIEQYPG